MVGVDAALAFLSKEYPAPKPDPAWITRCIALLKEHGHDPTTEAIHQQYLFTDLALSTLPTPPPFPPNKSASALHKITLFPKPTILQVNSLTEIASSAFQLQTVLEQRRDVLDGVNRIRQLDDPENGENIEEEIEEGKLPNYPRGMLKLELGDGRNTIKAIESRRLGGLKLGETELGAKILLHKVKVLRGILMLDPDNATVIGGGVEDMEVEQPAKFIAGLNKRLGKGVDEGDSQSATIQTALSHATDMKQERKPAVPPPNGSSTRHTAGPSTRGAQIPASRATQVPGPSGVRSKTAGNSRPTANLARSGSGTQSNDAIVIDDDDDDDDLCLAASRSRPQAKSAAGPSRPNTASGRAARSAALLAANKHVPSDDYDGLEANDSFLRQLDVIERGATSTLDDSSKRSEPLGLEDDFDDEYIDESFVRHIDEIEMKATNQTGRAPISETSTRSKRQRVVESEEDEILDSDKENRYSNREVIELLSD